MSANELFIVFTPQVLPYALAYMSSAGDSSPRNVLISRLDPETDESDELALLLSRLGHKLVSEDETRGSRFDRIHLLPTYQYFARTSEVLNQIETRSIVAHADFLRNGNFFHPDLIDRIDEVVNYGVALREISLDSTAVPQQLLQAPTVVPFGAVKEAWALVEQHLDYDPEPPAFSFGEDDLLVCERYWGLDWYRLNAGADLVGYLGKCFGDLPGIRRMVFRPHPWGRDQLPWHEACRSVAKHRDLQFETWSVNTENAGLAALLDHPEALLCLGYMDNLGAMFAFDSSLNLAFGLKESSAKLLWPDVTDLETIFRDQRLVDIVREQAIWMRTALELQSRQEADGTTTPIRVKTGGAGFFSVLADLHLRNFDHLFSQERGQRREIGNALDAQKESNLQLREERDEARSRSELLATELSQTLATVQAREDELRRVYDSRSWRYLKPLRLFRHLFNRLAV